MTAGPASTTGVDPEVAGRVARLNGRIGRPLRVLHIGNIANNGFNNARIQRQYGIAADVLSADNYHIMASPEWEEANVKEWPSDAFFPDWRSIDLGGYRRPRWFAAAPLADACRYLGAWADGDAVAAERLWAVMERERFIRCSRSPAARIGMFLRKVPLKLRYERRRIGTLIGLKARSHERAAQAAGAFGLADLMAIWSERHGTRPFPAKRADLEHYWERHPASGAPARAL